MLVFGGLANACQSHAVETALGEEVVEALEGEGGVGRAAAEARAEGDALVETDVDGGKVGEVGLEEAVGFEAEVVGGVGVEGEAGEGEGNRVDTLLRPDGHLP